MTDIIDQTKTFRLRWLAAMATNTRSQGRR